MIKLYEPTMMSDLVLAKLFTEMAYSGDLEKMLGPRGKTLSGFLALCQPPNTCLLGIDEGLLEMEGAWLWAHFEPCFSGAFVGMWVRPEKRGMKGSVRTVLGILEAGLKDYPVLLNITHQERLLEEHTDFGYRMVGEVPLLWGGRSVWLMQLTMEWFEGCRAKQVMDRAAAAVAYQAIGNRQAMENRLPEEAV